MTLTDRSGKEIVVGETAVGQVPGNGQVTGTVLRIVDDEVLIQDAGTDDDSHWCPAQNVEMQNG